ncbi:MAG TPA: hypothetical protein VME92_21490, partial [Acetobacteraceae bacterium]|nr:hypothetical protein [Acetobacteraceae bacterium]
TRDHVYMQGPMPSGAADYLSLSPDMHFTRIGSATVAGQPCVVWQMQATDGNGTGCVTADGVILRASGSDVKGQKGGVDALTVSYHPLPDSLFGPPPGFRRVSPPGQGAPPGQVAPPGQAAPPGQP